MTSALEVFHSGVGAAVLAPGTCVCWSVHVGQKRDFINPQGVDDDMHMDIAAVVMPVRVGADNGLVSGEMLLAELLAQLLRPVYGQAVVCPVPWVKADDIVVAFHIFPFLVFLHSGDWLAYRQRRNLRRRSSGKKCGNPPSVSSRPFSSRVGFMVNSSCSNVR